jgi:AcrR family transcriptional regulator
VALLLFTKQGFAATSIDQIAEECHSSKHTLYRRYKTKTELLAAVVDMARERVFRIVLEPRQADVRAILALRRACDQILERITEAEYVDFYRVCLAEGRNFPEIANKVVAGPNPVIEGVEHLVLKAQEQGDLRAGDACFMGRQLLYLVATIPTFRLMLQSKEFDTAEKRRAYIEKTWDLFMQGVQPRA